MIAAGQNVTLKVEKPAAGGRMIARFNGQVILVSGAIPGETVSAVVERVAKGVAYAATSDVGEPSPDRRAPFTDPACGGSLYAHIAYARQLAIKGQVIADAFGRIAHMPLAAEPTVKASPEEGYRMRARLHAGVGAGIGFFREGTHAICDARSTRQLLPVTCDAVDRLSERLARAAGVVHEIEVAENIDASERVVHLTLHHPERASELELEAIGGFSGVLAGDRLIAGQPHVTDTLLIQERPVVLRRHVLSFFQGNRFLLRDLVAHVVQGIEPGATVVDLYAGVGVFALAAAVGSGARVTAVEGDRVAAEDLTANAAASSVAIDTVHMDVERFVARPRPTALDVLIVDPPRTGMSNEALKGAISLGARRLIYVSCDVATLARDARKLVDAGYGMQAVDAFDLFPNTPHVETVVRFEKLRPLL